MFIIEALVEGLFEVLINVVLKYTGAAVRWLFLYRRYSFTAVLKQNWNTRIGILTYALLIGGIIWIVHHAGS